MTEQNDFSSILNFLKTRKSALAKALGSPGPNASQLEQILEIAVRVPDHGKLSPWRFIVFEGEARRQIGEKFAARWRELYPHHDGSTAQFQAGLLLRAPVVIAVVSTAAEHVKIPQWEQILSSGVVCYNLVLAATAMGFHAQWQTDWIAYDEGAKAAMGLTGDERISGIVYIGTSTVPLEDRPRPDIQALVTRWRNTE